MMINTGDGSIKHAADILHEVEDNRLLIENVPKIGLNNETMIGYSQYLRVIHPFFIVSTTPTI